MGKTKFNLRLWSSNSCYLQRLAAEEKTGYPNTTVGLYIGTQQLTHCPFLKQLSINTALLTKRDVLQTYSHIYDPLGWATLITIKANILQDIWQSQALMGRTSDIGERWISILADLLKLPKLIVPRPYFRRGMTLATLCVFRKPMVQWCVCTSRTRFV